MSKEYSPEADLVVVLFWIYAASMCHIHVDHAILLYRNRLQIDLNSYKSGSILLPILCSKDLRIFNNRG